MEFRFGHLKILEFGFVSDFVLRASNSVILLRPLLIPKFFPL